ncbi:glycosyltransferase family 39 protein [Gordonia sp. (in: high G+C Gram-positive bacteria)]|uniref:glycosyltransferase family 39 protein n=1 Tax=Gordonia sp. (in: high G+C Gram-positive bacteria) TaxID=84139 RepID=UPI003527E103
MTTTLSTDDTPAWRARVLRSRLHIEPRHWALAALLAATALLYLWNLSRNDWGNDFYAAAAQAGGENWKAWLFGSLDPHNVITVDKPPAALWVTGLFVRIFGLSSWSILVPQALMGVLSVWVLYATVRRVLLDGGSSRTATAGGLLAGAILALTPAAVLIFRFNNPDALLVLLMTVAAYCTVRACQQASARWIALCGVALGFAFLTKMLQGLIVVPGFGLAYLLFAQATWLKRIRDLALAVVALVVSAGWYVLLVDLWSTSSRPYIGGSEGNSFMDLVLGYNGFARIFGHSGGPGGRGSGGMTPPSGIELPEGMPGMGRGGPGGGGAGGAFGGEPGLARLFSNEFGNEISWLLPAALLVLLVALVLLAVRLIPALRARWGGLLVVDRTAAMGLTVFGTWLVINGLIFAYMSGIVHPYYTVALAPAIAALVAIGAVIGWRHRSTWAGTGFLALLLVSATGWGVARACATGFAWPLLGWVLGVVTLLGLAALVALRHADGARAATLAGAVVVAGGIAIGSFGIATANTTHTGAVPTAVHTSKGGDGMGFPGGRGGMSLPGGRHSGDRDRGGFGGPGMGGTADAEVIALLKGTDTKWAAATTGAQSQASLQLESGRAVMAIGGFGGGDPAPSLDQFKQWVAQGKIGYYIVGRGPGGMGGTGTRNGEGAPSDTAPHGGGFPGGGFPNGDVPNDDLPGGGFPGGGGGFPGMGGSRASSEIATWVSENFTATTVGGTTVYKLT